jgi:hypothetical protein
MSILVIIFPLVLGIGGVIYAGSPKTRRGLWSITACCLFSLIFILMLYNLPLLATLLDSYAGLMVMQGLFFAFLFPLPFVLLGWSKEVLSRVESR